MREGGKVLKMACAERHDIVSQITDAREGAHRFGDGQGSEGVSSCSNSVHCHFGRSWSPGAAGISLRSTGTNLAAVFG